MVHLFHLTCCFLVMRYEKISLTAFSTNAVEIGGRSAAPSADHRCNGAGSGMNAAGLHHAEDDLEKASSSDSRVAISTPLRR
jgi:hypothetical protein